MDATGSELTFVYKNQRVRRFRSDETEVTRMVSTLMNPPQGNDEFRTLPGKLFPEQFPFNYAELFEPYYFWNKYYITQRNCFAISKYPQYANYEILCNSLATRVTDLSQAEIYQLNNEEMTTEELERVLES